MQTTVMVKTYGRNHPLKIEWDGKLSPYAPALLVCPGMDPSPQVSACYEALTAELKSHGWVIAYHDLPGCTSVRLNDEFPAYEDSIGEVRDSVRLLFKTGIYTEDMLSEYVPTSVAAIADGLAARLLIEAGAEDVSLFSRILVINPWTEDGNLRHEPIWGGNSVNMRIAERYGKVPVEADDGRITMISGTFLAGMDVSRPAEGFPSVSKNTVLFAEKRDDAGIEALNREMKASGMKPLETVVIAGYEPGAAVRSFLKTACGILLNGREDLAEMRDRALKSTEEEELEIDMMLEGSVSDGT